MRIEPWNLERLRDESSCGRSCIFLTAAHLGLFTWLGEHQETVTGFIARFGGNPLVWEIFLDALCGIGLLRKRGGKYRNSSFAARALTGPAADALLPAYDSLRRWTGLAGVLLSGRRPAVQIPFSSSRNQTYRLLKSLDLDAQQIAPYLVSKAPVKNSGTLLDLGGGLGSYSVAFCRRYPRLQATLIEHPKVAPLARKAVAAAGMSSRIDVVGLDFIRKPLPQGFDTVLLSNVLHGHGDRENASLLVKVHESIKPRGLLILRDVFLRDDRTGPEWGTLFSVLLLLHAPRGRCYTTREIFNWLRSSGFSRITGPFRCSPLFFDPDQVLLARP